MYNKMYNGFFSKYVPCHCFEIEYGAQLIPLRIWLKLCQEGSPENSRLYSNDIYSFTQVLWFMRSHSGMLCYSF